MPTNKKVKDLEAGDIVQHLDAYYEPLRIPDSEYDEGILIPMRGNGSVMSLVGSATVLTLTQKEFDEFLDSQIKRIESQEEIKVGEKASDNSVVKPTQPSSNEALKAQLSGLKSKTKK